jgi:NAD(P)-dependent dehydrogenase (short-subunit alcohol dehydrogenase family)
MPSSPSTLVSTGRSRSDTTRVALVTGGGRGLGRLAAHALARAGAAVGVIARSGHELDETVELIRGDGGTAAAAPADVTDPAGMGAAVAEIRRRLGPVDLLINNAGVVGPVGPLWETNPDAWWSTMDVNVRGLVLTTQLVLPDMVARRCGGIVNVTSQAGVHRWPLVSAYSVSKAAVAKLTENLAHEVRRHRISVFSVHPGLLPIGLTETVTAPATSTPYEDHVRRWTMNELRAGRGADPARAVELLLRLAAGDADPLSGRHLSVHDDLDALLAHLREVLRDDLYVLRPDRLPGAGHRSGSLPAYVRGRRADDWQSALRSACPPDGSEDTPEQAA